MTDINIASSTCLSATDFLKSVMSWVNLNHPISYVLKIRVVGTYDDSAISFEPAEDMFEK